jgi:hypothetical protein
MHLLERICQAVEAGPHVDGVGVVVECHGNLLEPCVPDFMDVRDGEN